ncbi:uncharacterized protein LOC125498647 [Beta vulgaris subsp. vulgaris]|uniref:uncharacterized protein LOC125498647 n=1 Tax=Beta vulgaris subsp. vulgaris TaxID=3555 RepID=UPI00203699CB|nr:uncharacterized protein LOC125498647 [Beta vulgaris subsp. vulgaris]
MSGQLVNFHKSSFQCTSNVCESDVSHFASLLQMSNSLSFGNYLGCPVIESRVTKNTFHQVVQSSHFQLSKWKANSLSQAGRSVLLQANLSSKANFQMQSFLLPTSIHGELDTFYRNFFWSKAPDSRSPSLFGWDRICTPKKFGGLGFRKAAVNNAALQMKLLWKIVKSPANLWVDLVSKKYLRGSSLFNYSPSASCSWQWRKLMSLRTVFKQGLRWIVNRGDSVSFWNDNWVFHYPISAICDPPMAFENLKVNDVIDEHRQWDKTRLLTLVSAHVVQSILSIFLPSLEGMHSLVWGLSPDGEYSVKTGALLVQGIALRPPLPTPFSWIWKMRVPPKVKNFLWKVCQDGLPTKDQLQTSHVFTLQECCFCNHPSEDANHLFFLSPFAQDVFSLLWEKMGWSCLPIGSFSDNVLINISYVFRNSSMDDVEKDWVSALSSDELLGSKVRQSVQVYCGFVIRNHEGVLQLSGSMPLSAGCSILAAEAWGLREGLRAAVFLGISSLAIEGDNLEANQAADFMAHRGHEVSSLVYSFSSSNIAFSSIIRKDAVPSLVVFTDFEVNKISKVNDIKLNLPIEQERLTISKAIKENNIDKLDISVLNFNNTQLDDDNSPHFRETTFLMDDENRCTKVKESHQEELKPCIDLEETIKFIGDLEPTSSNSLKNITLAHDSSTSLFRPIIELRSSYSHPKFYIFHR